MHEVSVILGIVRKNQGASIVYVRLLVGTTFFDPTSGGTGFFGLWSGGIRKNFNRLEGGDRNFALYMTKHFPQRAENTSFACFRGFQPIMCFGSNHHTKGGPRFIFIEIDIFRECPEFTSGGPANLKKLAPFGTVRIKRGPPPYDGSTRNT